MYLEPAVIILVAIAIGITLFCLCYSIKNKKETIETQKRKINSLNSNLQDKKQELSERKRDLEYYKAKIADQDKQIRALNLKIDKLTEALISSQHYIEEKEAELSEMQSTVSEQKIEIEKLQNDVNFYSDITAASQDLNDNDDTTDVKLSDLDEEQRAAFDLMMNTDQNLFITGKAGTGKSALLRVFARETTKCILKVAPTGIAAVNINGSTLHSAFGYDNLVKLSYDHIKYIEQLHLNSDKQRVLKNVRTIIIDEISMVRSDILEKVDRILKIITGSDSPFGGKQMIFFGDIFQLPPIADKDERHYLTDAFEGIHFFNSFAYKNGNFKFIELTVNHRQNGDERFFDILNKIREGKVSATELDVINERTSFSEDELRVVTRLFSKKADAEAFNQMKLKQSLGREFVSKAQIIFPQDGKYPKKDCGKFEMNFPVTEILKLKKGSLVMFVKNNGDKWANGTLGIVSDIYEDKLRVSIDSIEHDVYPTEFEQLEARYEKGEITYKTVCAIRQYPVVLAYAMTIHKSQGQTYGKVACDLSDCFAPGQAYVALSRVKSLKGLYLLNEAHKSQIMVDTAANDFYKMNKCSSRYTYYKQLHYALKSHLMNVITAPLPESIPQPPSKPIVSPSHIPFNPPLPTLQEDIETYKASGTAPFNIQELCKDEKGQNKYRKACNGSFEIIEKSPYKYKVRSCKSNEEYWVSFRECSCESNRHEHRPCKHMLWLAYTHGLIPAYTDASVQDN